ncbi:hypothetical protein [Pseudodesulfovibrio sediminis]|uniref:hypothetical protein n=1 Tax=Pseudodesulfovibrio sediminis TaxID=2810563 RepID=UPI001E4931EF|nr:hypothetical protein [Pseudodesulfovibrio sediminis]
MNDDTKFLPRPSCGGAPKEAVAVRDMMLPVMTEVCPLEAEATVLEKASALSAALAGFGSATAIDMRAFPPAVETINVNTPVDGTVSVSTAGNEFEI